VFASYTRTSNGKYRWSISFTIPSSNQTVRISRGTPSIVTRTEWLLRAPEGGEKAGKARPAEFALHVPREGVVVRDLLLDFQELVVQASAFFVDVPQGLAEALLAVPPPFRFLAGCLHRARFPRSPEYLIVMRSRFFLHLRAGQDVFEEVEQVHRLVHEVPRDPLAGVDAEHELHVVDLPDADETRDGPVRRGFGHANFADQVLTFPGRREGEHVATALKLLLRDCRHLGLFFLCHREHLPAAQSGQR